MDQFICFLPLGIDFYCFVLRLNVIENSSTLVQNFPKTRLIFVKSTDFILVRNSNNLYLRFSKFVKDSSSFFQIY